MEEYEQTTMFSAQNEKTAEVPDILVEAPEAISSVDGCRFYVVGKDSEVQNHVQVVELRDSKDDHESTLEKLTANELVAQARPLLNGRPETIELDVIGGLETMEAK